MSPFQDIPLGTYELAELPRECPTVRWGNEGDYPEEVGFAPGSSLGLGLDGRIVARRPDQTGDLARKGEGHSRGNVLHIDLPQPTNYEDNFTLPYEGDWSYELQAQDTLVLYRPGTFCKVTLKRTPALACTEREDCVMQGLANSACGQGDFICQGVPVGRPPVATYRPTPEAPSGKLKLLVLREDGSFHAESVEGVWNGKYRTEFEDLFGYQFMTLVDEDGMFIKRYTYHFYNRTRPYSEGFIYLREAGTTDDEVQLVHSDLEWCAVDPDCKDAALYCDATNVCSRLP